MSGVDPSCLRKQLDNVCVVLFDRWCERREVTSLRYLLHACPFLPSTPRLIGRVSASLRELLTLHPDSPGTQDRRLKASLLSLAGQ
ncbi:hypothetical protein [Caballeronia ptereochthonis]|uniref:hypothetical protein n=1 Tax=Caballeronia ptereochthonis TaxID=1777144 RepID=UPI001FC9C5F6|nr:hypothetical protein [Caballeronia ptereochthonis]